MARVIKDTIDFSSYMEQTEPKSKVRRASQFEDELLAQFARDSSGARDAHMFSTKLREGLDFRPGEITVWAGYNGHRKSMFAGQVALDMCVQKERVLIISLEMKPQSTLARMARQACARKNPPSDFVRSFMRWTDDRLWLFDHFGRITPALCIAVLRYFAEELKGTHVFIDSMMMVVGSEESMDEQKQFTTDLVRVSQETNIHAHLIAHCKKPQSTGENFPPSKYDVRGSSAISDQAHNVITIWANKHKVAELAKDAQNATAAAEPDARVCLEKQRNGAWEGAVKLWFDEDSMRFCDDRIARVEPYVLSEAR
jgi:twinkle protein